MLLPVNGLYGHIARNNTKSTLLLAGFVGLVALYWYAVCLGFEAIAMHYSHGHHGHYGRDTATGFLAIARTAADAALARWYVPIVVSLCWFAVAWTLHKWMIRTATGARPVERRLEPQLYNMVENLAITAGLPMPRVEIMESGQHNAYASGLMPGDAVIAVTRGLLETLAPQELEAVLAHEMTHIKNRDVRLMVVAFIFCGGLTVLGRCLLSGNPRETSIADAGDAAWGVSRVLAAGAASKDGDDDNPNALATILAIVAAVVLLAFTHVAALLSQLALSRAREYMADGGAVELTKNPDALISALKKISGHDAVPLADENLRAMMISSPFEAMEGFASLFSTHPSLSSRISSLVNYAGGNAEATFQRREARRPGQPALAAGARGTFGRRRSIPAH